MSEKEMIEWLNKVAEEYLATRSEDHNEELYGSYRELAEHGVYSLIGWLERRMDGTND